MNKSTERMLIGIRWRETWSRLVQKYLRQVKNIITFYVSYHVTVTCFNDIKYSSKSQHHITYQHYIHNM